MYLNPEHLILLIVKSTFDNKIAFWEKFLNLKFQFFF
jgi:hypothetical protein